MNEQKCKTHNDMYVQCVTNNILLNYKLYYSIYLISKNQKRVASRPTKVNKNENNRLYFCFLRTRRIILKL